MNPTPLDPGRFTGAARGAVRPGLWWLGVAFLIVLQSVGGARAVEPVDLTGVEFLRPSDDYRVWVNGEEQVVFKSLKTGNHGTHDIISMSFASFDLTRPAEIKVLPRTRATTFAVRPFNSEIKASLEDNAISFELATPQHAVVTVNDSYDPVLVISAKPPQRPPRPEEVSHFFGPGVHDIGRHLPLKSGDHVYVSTGAIVKGSFGISNAENVRITGRGIIYNGHFPHEEAFRVFKGDGTRNVLIEGVTVCNAPGWIVSFWGGNTNLTVRDVTMVGHWWMNSDGVQTGTDGLLVENCFMQCNDDNFSLNGVCKNVVIRNNVLWNIFNGGVFMLGWATGQQFDLENLDIHDNVVLRAGGCCDYDRKAPIAMKLFGWGRSARDIHFRNLVIEDIAPYGRWIDLQADKANRSTLRDFTFENIEVLKTWKVEGEVRGNAEACLFENLAFENVTIGGKPMLTPTDGGLHLVHTTNVTINGQPFCDGSISEPDPQLARPAGVSAGQSGTPPSAGPNLLGNPAFEDGLAGWRTSNPAGAELVSVACDSDKETTAVRVEKREGADFLEFDVTDILRERGPGEYTWAAKVRGDGTPLSVKATLVIEDETGTQQHPAPDVQVTHGVWVRTERRSPLDWSALKRASLRVESTWGPAGTFYVDDCWLSR